MIYEEKLEYIGKKLADVKGEIVWCDTKWQKGYVSRKQKKEDVRIHIGGGSRKGNLYILCPSWRSTNYCIRYYFEIK